MKNIRFILSMLVIVVFMTSSCKKDRLLEEYDTFEGRWRWIHTYSQKTVFSNIETRLNPANSGFEASVEFHDNGTVTFYVDNKEVGNSWYRILEQSINDDNSLTIKTDFKIKNAELDLSGNRWFSIANDTLNFVGFPYEGYTNSQDKVSSAFFERY